MSDGWTDSDKRDKINRSHHQENLHKSDKSDCPVQTNSMQCRPDPDVKSNDFTQAKTQLSQSRYM